MAMQLALYMMVLPQILLDPLLVWCDGVVTTHATRALMHNKGGGEICGSSF